MLLAEEKITFSWSNLCVEVPGGSSRRCCGILPSKGDPKPPKQILRNGKQLKNSCHVSIPDVQLAGLFVPVSFLPSWEPVVQGNPLFSTPFSSATLPG